MKVLSCGPDEELVMRTSGEDRKPGLHLSDITKRMVFEQDKKYHPDSPIDAMVLERGFTWERILELALASRQQHASHKGREPGYRPEQLQEEGVWLSPDWVEPDDPIAQAEEWKATKKSKRRGFDDISWTWMPNSMAYLRALLRRGLVSDLAIRFRIWWINGDYSYESKTSDFHLLNDYWSVVCQFEKRELEENWSKIISAGRRYGLLKGSREDSWRDSHYKKKAPPSGNGKVPPSSRETANSRVVTFPSTRRSPRPRDES